MKYILLAVLIFSISTANSRSQEIRSIDSLVNKCIENNFINGDILIEVDHRPFYTRTVGYRDNAKQEELRPNSIFNIGSVSKPFTSVAVLQLQEKELLNMNDRVNQYLPLFPYGNICIEHLLSHTSGLVADIGERDKVKFLTNDSLVNSLIRNKPKLEFDPGDGWSYSNLGYDILAVIVEQVSQMKFEDYMDEYIFRPAGMSRTFIARTKNTMQWLPKGLTEKDVALPHRFETIASCSVINIDSLRNDIIENCYFYGSSNVYSTVHDLAKFDEALIDHKILSKATQDLAYTPYELNNGGFATDSLAPIPSYYGLGWEISSDTSGGKILWHKGRSGGTRTVLLRNPDRKQVVVVADNNDNPSTDLKAIAFLKIMDHQPYRDPIHMSLVQKFGCDITSLGYEAAYMKFEERKASHRQNYFISKDEMVDLAILLASRNNLKDALSVMELGNELFPEYWWLLINYGDLLFRDQQPDQAILIYTNAVHSMVGSEEDRVSLLGSVGYQFIETGRLNDAELVLRLNTELFPTDCNSYDNYAFILDKENKLDLAIAVQEKAVALAKEQDHELLKPLQENLEKLKAKK